MVRIYKIEEKLINYIIILSYFFKKYLQNLDFPHYLSYYQMHYSYMMYRYTMYLRCDISRCVCLISTNILYRDIIYRNVKRFIRTDVSCINKNNVMQCMKC